MLLVLWGFWIGKLNTSFLLGRVGSQFQVPRLKLILIPGLWTRTWIWAFTLVRPTNPEKEQRERESPSKYLQLHSIPFPCHWIGVQSRDPAGLDGACVFPCWCWCSVENYLLNDFNPVQFSPLGAHEKFISWASLIHMPSSPLNEHVEVKNRVKKFVLFSPSFIQKTDIFFLMDT